ncbi:ATPase family gene 2 protein [Bienertia sinuspersici]
MVEEYCAHNEKMRKKGGGTVRVASYERRWCPPNDAVKVNVDAHVSVDGGVGLGAVIRYHRGKIKVDVVLRIKASWKPEVAEAHAALYGVQVASRLGFSKVVLESDAMQVVNAIIREAKGALPIFLFYDEINSLKFYFDSFNCNHVKRRGNCVAGLIARGEVAEGSERVWLDPIPQNFCNLAEIDLI